MKRIVVIFCGVALLFLLLVGAAFVGGRLLSGQRQMDDPGVLFEDLPGGVGMWAGESGGLASSVSKVGFVVEMAEELPETEPDVIGFFARREDNSIFVGSMGDGVGVAIFESEDGSINMDLPAGGPEVEVVVTAETEVYKDVTELSFDAPSGSGSIQQKVEPGSADEIGDQSSVTVWGQRHGDRVVAQVLLYSEPRVFAMPKP